MHNLLAENTFDSLFFYGGFIFFFILDCLLIIYSYNNENLKISQLSSIVSSD